MARTLSSFTSSLNNHPVLPGSSRSAMNRRAKYRIVTWATIFALMAIAGLGAVNAWPRICGNKPIQVYGRIVDEHGVGIGHANVIYKITYSRSPAIPLTYSGAESINKVSIRTDANGSYFLGGVYGLNVALAGVEVDGKPLASAMGIPATEESAWSLDDRSAVAKMPTDPTRRITYKFRRAQ
jgi:hypothetical protein